MNKQIDMLIPVVLLVLLWHNVEHIVLQAF